jgi:hypothetical protein
LWRRLDVRARGCPPRGNTRWEVAHQDSSIDYGCGVQPVVVVGLLGIV